jgi:tRNA threonylcarbamoyladenosine biosynthesis protein TsaB
MRTLAIDQSGPIAGLCLLEDNTVVVSRSWTPERRSHHLLYTNLRDALNEGNTDVSQLDQIVVGKGPGGFTSLRIAAAAISGLTIPGSPTLQGISSGAALAYGLIQSRGCKTVTVVGDARRNRFWIGRAAMVGDDCRMTRDWEILDAEKAAEECRQAKCVVSPDYDRISGFLIDHAGESLIMNEAAILDPADLARLGVARYEAGTMDEDIKPIYLHPAVFVEPRFPVAE